MVRRVLAWIRHGEYAQPAGVPSAHLPHGLTPRGREQALTLAHGVRGFVEEQGLELDTVVDCSRLRRAWETARLMASELERLGSRALHVKEFDALSERSLGAAANLTLEEIEAVLAADPRYERPPVGWKRDPGYVLPLSGAESLGQAGRRVAQHVMARMRDSAGSASLTLFVGHGGAFRHAACELGLLSSAEAGARSMQHATPIYFEYQTSGAAERLIHVAGEWGERSAAAPVD